MVVVHNKDALITSAPYYIFLNFVHILITFSQHGEVMLTMLSFFSGFLHVFGYGSLGVQGVSLLPSELVFTPHFIEIVLKVMALEPTMSYKCGWGMQRQLPYNIICFTIIATLVAVKFYGVNTTLKVFVNTVTFSR